MRIIGFLCVILSLGALLHCQSRECTPQARTCRGSALILQCSPRGQWLEATCPPGSSCSQGKCITGVVVVPDGSTTETPAPDNPAPDNKTTCQENARRCAAPQSYAICIAGQWQNKACPAQQYCSAGQCIDPTNCPEGTRRCKSATSIERCEGGAWKTLPCPSNQGCKEGQCQPIATCQEGNRRCDDPNTLAECHGGQWKQAPCPSNTTCQGAQCKPNPQCTDGNARCANANTLEACRAGQWQQSPCPPGQRCANNRCSTPPPPGTCSPACGSGQICRLGKCESWPVSYRKIPFEGNKTDRDPPKHADLNPRLRGWQKIAGQSKGLVDYNGPTDSNAPKLFAMFPSNKFPGIVENYQAGEWDWGSNSKRGWVTSTAWKVHYVGFKTTPGERISIPSRRPIIYTNANALVLYVTNDSITFVYTREDTVANGYAVHVIGVTVAEDLKKLYQQTASRSSRQLPALENGKPFGVAIGGEVLVAVRDRGTFMDPRARKDWW